ncbi:MAG: hypothetical protein QOD06_2973, partial [Candidatus Binatota bacterium]|nr:hypothetical protein [Candidatus Binatota bacterium]
GVFGEQAWYDYSSLLALLDRRIPGFRRRHVRWMKRLGLDRRSRERVILDHYIDPGQMVSIEKDWPQWSRVLLQIRDLARSRGAAVLFVVFPIDTRIAEHASETAPILTRFAAENDIPLLDLVKVFAESREPVLIDYTHPNAIGHRLAAKAIADAILERFADSRGAAAAHVPARSGLRESRARDISGEFSGGETAFREVR